MLVNEFELFSVANKSDELYKYCREEGLDYSYIVANMKESTNEKGNTRKDTFFLQRFFNRISSRIGQFNLSTGNEPVCGLKIKNEIVKR